MIRNVLLAIAILLLAQSPSLAQPNARKENICPEYSEVDPLLECLTIDSYAGLADLIENAPSGSEVTLCPFVIRKVTSVEPITINSGVRVHCARIAADQFCTIIGLGNHLVIDTAEDTLWQGLSFRGSNDHAVLISGDADNAEFATHTFCQTSFLENIRVKDSRGGALMLEKSAGTVNIFECFFQENFSKTFGAAIYSRTTQLNIFYSLFVKNRSMGYGPALFTAIGGDLMITSSLFMGNRGRGGHDIVFNPGNGTSIYKDGFENSVNNGECRGVFNLAEESCIVFERSPPSPFPTIPPTEIPTLRPTVIPTHLPTIKYSPNPTTKPSSPPSPFPTNFPTDFPTLRPTTYNPTIIPTTKPLQNTNATPIQVITTMPSLQPIKATTQVPITTPPTPTTTVSQKPTANNKTGSPIERSTIIPSSQPMAEPNNTPIEINSSNQFVGPALVTVKPTVRSTLSPTETTKSSTAVPTSEKNDTSRSPESTNENLGEVISNKCLFRMIPTGKKCVDATSFEEFKVAIETGGNDVIFCGGFNFRKTGLEAIQISNDINIRCIDQCSFYGVGPFLNVGGLSKIRLQNLKFVNSQDSSAVIVSTVAPVAQTTFCDIEFLRNEVSTGNHNLGGAITIRAKSGVVNVVNNTFTGNIASRGGAIQGNGFKLNIVESKFVANNAYNSGNAIFMGDGSHLSIQSSTFILNTEVSTRSSGREGRGIDRSAAIAVQPNTSIRVGSNNESFHDGGSNQVVLSGSCNGIYFPWKRQCQKFK